VILEAFLPGTEPTAVSSGRPASFENGAAPETGGSPPRSVPSTGGLY